VQIVSAVPAPGGQSGQKAAVLGVSQHAARFAGPAPEAVTTAETTTAGPKDVVRPNENVSGSVASVRATTASTATVEPATVEPRRHSFSQTPQSPSPQQSQRPLHANISFADCLPAGLSVSDPTVKGNATNDAKAPILFKPAFLRHHFPEVVGFATVQPWVSDKPQFAAISRPQIRFVGAAGQIIRYLPGAEQIFIQLWAAKLQQTCQSNNTVQKLVLDIGANMGVFGIWAAKAGCVHSTYLFDPQPGCQRMIKRHICANGPWRNFRENKNSYDAQQLGTNRDASSGSQREEATSVNLGSGAPVLIPHPLMDVNAKVNGLMVDERTGCSGHFGLHRQYATIENSTKKKSAPGVSLANVLQGDSLLKDHLESVSDDGSSNSTEIILKENWEFSLVKIDVEGGEIGVLRMLLPFFKAKQIRTCVWEATPDWWGQVKVTRSDVWAVMETILKFGYKLVPLDRKYFNPNGASFEYAKTQFLTEEVARNYFLNETTKAQTDIWLERIE